jgi:hypothetical protein
MAAWPGTLPQTALVDSLQAKITKSVVEFQPDAGPPIRRARYSQHVKTYPISMIMTVAQRNTFETFYLANEALLIDFPDPHGGVLASFWFDEPPNYTTMGTGDRFLVAFSIARLV